MNPSSVFLFLNRACNLSCSHCYVSAQPKLEGDMKLEVFIQAVDAFLKRGVSDFRLTGGEPTIHRDFLKMLDILSGKGISPRLITNGLRLLKMREPDRILKKTSRCWISVYGTSDSQHSFVAGRGAASLSDILAFAGAYERLGRWVGVSVLLTEIRLDDLDELLGAAARYGVRNLRFIFGERKGRGAMTLVGFPHIATQRETALQVTQRIRDCAARYSFDLVSINNPFDLESTGEKPEASCLLHGRNMWSVSPEGAIYSCCFNIYDPSHLVAERANHDALSSGKVGEAYAPKCNALTSGFWGGATTKPTCPISALKILDSGTGRFSHGLSN